MIFLPIAMNILHPRKAKGFTLMETLLAVALIGMLISIFLTVFVPARGMVQKALTKQESDRVISILRAELNTVRESERSKDNKASSPGSYTCPFDKGFYWILASTKPSTSVVVFSYRADTKASVRADGSYPPIPITESRPGGDTQLVSMACTMDNPIHKKDIMHAVGPVFLVKLTQIEPDHTGVYRLAKAPGIISKASSPQKYFSSEDSSNPWGGAIFFRADFYLMVPPNPARYKNRPWSRVGRPIFSTNMSIRR